MKITFPHMGSLYIALEALLQELGFEVVVPPPCTKRTLDLGSKYSPEVACLPLKVMIGNFLEAHQLGAEAIIMLGGCGPCRLGYYAEVQRQILDDLGTKLDVLILEPPLENPVKIRQDLARLLSKKGLAKVPRALIIAWEKLKACESLEYTALKARPRERQFGLTSKMLAKALKQVRQAGGVKAVRQAAQHGKEGLLAIQGSRSQVPLQVGVVGEIYTVLEPFVNLRLEERLGHLGVEVIKTISMVEWVKDHVVRQSFGVDITKELRRSAVGYLRDAVGGHGLETIARTKDLAKDGVDGVIQILPFTCMPEVIAQAILPDVSLDHNLPLLSLVVDEHTGEAGFQTRIEAFVDLLQRQRRGVVYG